jgi:hypothetical protein
MNPTLYTIPMAVAEASVLATSFFRSQGADTGRRLGPELALAGSDAR